MGSASKFCAECGTPVGRGNPTSLPESGTAVSAKLLVLGLAGAVVLGGAFFGWQALQKDPEVSVCEAWYSHPTSVSHLYFVDTADADIEFLRNLAEESSGTPVGRVMGDYASAYASYYSLAVQGVENGWDDFLTSLWESAGDRAETLRTDLVIRCDAALENR